jgi:hypothetical protein
MITMDSRTQSKLEYWDEYYPDYCRTLYTDWQRSQELAGLDEAAATRALHQMVRDEIAGNRSLALYMRECLRAAVSPEQRLERDVLDVPRQSMTTASLGGV